MNDQNYKLEELLKDRTFHNWVHQSNRVDVDYWNSYLAANPNQADLLEEAALLIKGIPVVESNLPLEKVTRLWLDVENKILARERSTGYGKLWLTFAAGLVALMIGVFYFVYHNTSSVSYSTKAGEEKKIVLPDHSTVILNPNSTITYFNSSDKNSPREVLLTGVAFFSVRHTLNNQKFIVKTSNNFNIEVLGTEFNVSNTQSGTSVILFSGKIKVINAGHTDEAITMNPGEMIVFEKETNNIIRKKVDPNLYYPGNKNKMFLENLTVAEIADLIKENYGVEIQFTDNKIKEKRFTGTFQVDKLNLLFDALSESFDLKYTRKENIVLLKPFKQNF